MTHAWDDKDELIAYLLFRRSASQDLVEASARVIGCSPASLQMRIENLRNLDNGTQGLPNVAQRTVSIYSAF